MTRKCLSLLLAIAVFGAAVTGCRGKVSPAEENEGEVQTEQQAEEEEETTNEGEESTEAVVIELPEQEKMKTDYTTVQGLELAKATRIAVVVKSTKSGYWQAVRTGMQKAVDDLNAEAGLEGEDQIYLTFEAPDHEQDAEGQINIVDAVLSENPQVLCLAAIDMSSCAVQLETAEENGIPVIVLDSGVAAEELVYSVCKTDNYAAGSEAAGHLAESLGGRGTVIVAASEQKGEAIAERIRGFTAEMRKTFPGITVQEVLYADEETEETELSFQQRLARRIEETEGAIGCFATNQAIAGEVLSVLDEYREQERTIKMVGFDAGERQLEAIRNGTELGTVCQNPYGMGYATIASAARAVLGLENDQVIDAGYQWIDSSNIDMDENQKYLYE